MVPLTLEEKSRFVEMMSDIIPHTRGLGIEPHAIEGDELTLRLPYQVQLVGDPATGILHSGVLTVLLDQTLGLATVCCDDIAPAVAPTLDLRIDHLAAAPAGRDIFAAGRVFKATRRVLFVEGLAWYESRDKPIARATGTFVRVMTIDPAWIRDTGLGIE